MLEPEEEFLEKYPGPSKVPECVKLPQPYSEIEVGWHGLREQYTCVQCITIVRRDSCIMMLFMGTLLIALWVDSQDAH